MRLEQLVQVKLLIVAAIVEMKMDSPPISTAADALHERRAIPKTRAIVHLERSVDACQLLGHAQDGSHSNSTGEQDMVRDIWCERKPVARIADAKRLALFQIVHCC